MQEYREIRRIVLIVAKCNVNAFDLLGQGIDAVVLIVAKCNVNLTYSVKNEGVIIVLIVAKCNVNPSITMITLFCSMY